MIAGKVVIDGLVTAARAWVDDGSAESLSVEERGELAVAVAAADALGARLWQYNYDAYNYGGPPEKAHPDLLAEVEESGDLAVRPDYTYEPLPGDPAPDKVQRLIDFYVYQCEGDDWPGTDVERFVSALQSSADVHAAGTDLRQLPGYGQVPWDPDEADRNMFAPGI